MTSVLLHYSELHHGSHNQLIDEVPPPAKGRLDAIIVPTIHDADTLRDSLQLASDLRRPLVALCSRQAQARELIALSYRYGTDVLAIDLHEASARMPAFRADDALGESEFASASDLSLKRNLGLLISRGAGWERVLFLDDDIIGVVREEIEGAAAVLDSGRYRAVGLLNEGFPDNSVVCHANREMGGRQDSFIGGGAMIVDPLATRSFFPNIYNEDWFFLLGDNWPFRAARSGRMTQRRFDPFANPRRAEDEELGDTLAEGLFCLLDDGERPQWGDKACWADFLFRRRCFLECLLAEVDAADMDGGRRTQMTNSLKAARGASAFITPYLCNAFLQGWRSDLRTWDIFLEGFPTTGGTGKALAELGLAHVAHYSRPEESW